MTVINEVLQCYYRRSSVSICDTYYRWGWTEASWGCSLTVTVCCTDTCASGSSLFVHSSRMTIIDALHAWVNSHPPACPSTPSMTQGCTSRLDQQQTPLTRLSVCLSVCLPACLFACLPVCLSVCLSVCWPVCPSTCPSIHLSSCLSVRPSICPSICPSTHPSIHPSICIRGDPWVSTGNP